MTLSAVDSSPPLSADERITAERHEIKYLVVPQGLEALVQELNRELPPHRFAGDGANRLPDAHHFVTTIYFDTPSRAYYRASLVNADANVKIRAKEYYDLHPALAELATHPDHIVRYQPWLWFELKRKDGTRTSKRRVRVPKRGVPILFAGGRIVPDALLGPELAPKSAELAGIEEIVTHCRGLDEPLSAACLVNYRRLSWQAADGSLRITIDLGLAFYAPPEDLWTRERALVRDSLGPPADVLGDAVVEVKVHGATPLWVESALARAGARSIPFSKFVAGSGAVDGGG
ncbi:MAG TPA: polyphosphate polymerase domain-containing protein [Polyangiaceae bacterium]|nr:polyphosphate polymerase domain-containing protein [Polyangiaceae bacterium]